MFRIYLILTLVWDTFTSQNATKQADHANWFVDTSVYTFHDISILTFQEAQFETFVWIDVAKDCVRFLVSVMLFDSTQSIEPWQDESLTVRVGIGCDKYMLCLVSTAYLKVCGSPEVTVSVSLSLHTIISALESSIKIVLLFDSRWLLLDVVTIGADVLKKYCVWDPSDAFKFSFTESANMLSMWRLVSVMTLPLLLTLFTVDDADELKFTLLSTTIVEFGWILCSSCIVFFIFNESQIFKSRSSWMLCICVELCSTVNFDLLVFFFFLNLYSLLNHLQEVTRLFNCFFLFVACFAKLKQHSSADVLDWRADLK